MNTPLFIDTNVLVHATDRNSLRFAAATQGLERYRIQFRLTCSSQVLREYLSATKRRIPSMPNEQILQNAENFMRHFAVLYSSAASVYKLFELARQFTPSRRDIHDCNIVATMLANDVTYLFTENVSDFEIYRQARLITIIPL